MDRDRAVTEPSRIVDVGEKDVTAREATAACSFFSTAVARLLERTPKGDPVEAARIAGIMAAKRTPGLLPFCHPVAITGAEVAVQADVAAGRVTVTATVRATDRTGVEMEALTAAAVAALTLYDAAKAYDRAARIDDLRLVGKRGGRSGEFRADG